MENTKYEGRLIPIMREGVDVIKMILFKKLKASLSIRNPGSQPVYITRLTGAVINDLFGTPNLTEPFLTFARENRERIDEEMGHLAREFADMRIPLTDALRVQFLCDSQEGIDSSFILARASEIGILIVEREVPLPASFMNLVRRLGSAHDLLARQT